MFISSGMSFGVALFAAIFSDTSGLVTICKMRSDHCFLQLGHVATVNMFTGSSYEI